jgi:hypothetical protein
VTRKLMTLLPKLFAPTLPFLCQPPRRSLRARAARLRLATRASGQRVLHPPGLLEPLVVTGMPFDGVHRHHFLRSQPQAQRGGFPTP